MTDERRDPRGEPHLAPEDAAFVRRLADAYAPPPQRPQERVAFRAALDRRLERERRKPWISALGGLAAAGLALVLVLGGPAADPPARRAPLADDTPEEAMLTFAAVDLEDGEDEEAPLPADYEAIASLFLGEV